MRYYEYVNNGNILCGDSLGLIAEEIKAKGCKNVFFIKSNDSDPKIVKKITQTLEKGKVAVRAVYSSDKGVALTSIVNKLLNLYYTNGCDCLLAFGASDIIYMAKALKLLVVSRHNDIKGLEGMNNVSTKTYVPLVVVSSDRGTGVEMTRATVLHDEERNTFTYLNSNNLCDVCIIDPSVESDLDLDFVFGSAIDTLAHAIESYTSRLATEITRGFSIKSLRNTGKFLPMRFSDPKDKNAIKGLQEASVLAAIAYSNAFGGIAHAIAHAITQSVGLSHIKAIALILPHAIRYNVQFNDEEYSKLLLHLAGEDVYLSLKKEDRGLGFAQYVGDFIAQFSKGLNFPLTLKQAKIKDEDIEKIADLSLADSSFLVNRGRATKEDIISILNSAR